MHDMQSTAPAIPRLYTIGEAAELLRVSRRHAYTLAAEGTLETVKIGGCRRVREDAILKLVGAPA